MAPQREGTEVIILPAPTRLGERPSQTSYPAGSGKSIVSGTWFRPVVIEQTVDGFDTHNIGITPPGQAPIITGYTSGSYASTDTLYFVRVDSTRDRFSELSPGCSVDVPPNEDDPDDPEPPVVPPGDDPPTGGGIPIDTLDEGIPLGMDLVYGTYTVRTAIIQRGITFAQVVANSYGAPLRDFQIKVRLAKFSSATDLTGTVRIRVLRDSQKLDETPPAPDSANDPVLVDQTFQASLIREPEFQTFSVRGRATAEQCQFDPPPYETEDDYTVKYKLIITWSESATTTDNCILVEGYYDAFQDTIYDVAEGITIPASAASIPVSSLTRVGFVVTAATSEPHGFLSRQIVTIAGANESAYNETAEVTVVNSTTFTYLIAQTPTSPATGVITAKSSSLVWPPAEQLAEDALDGNFNQGSGTWLERLETLSQTVEEKNPDNLSRWNMWGPWAGTTSGTYQGNGGSLPKYKWRYYRVARINSLPQSGGSVPASQKNVFGQNVIVQQGGTQNQWIYVAVENMPPTPSSLLNTWVRVCTNTLPRTAFITGQVVRANANRIVLAGWAWHCGNHYIDPGADGSMLYPSPDGLSPYGFIPVAPSQTTLEQTGRLYPEAGDKVSGASPDIVRATCYSVIDGNPVQDVGPAWVTVNIGEYTAEPPMPGAQSAASSQPSSASQPSGSASSPSQVATQSGGTTPIGQSSTAGTTFGYVVSNLDRLFGDEATDEYDAVAPVVYDRVDGEYYLQQPIYLPLPESVNITSKVKTSVWAPFQNYVFPAFRIIRTYTNEGTTRLVGVGMGGFDCFLDQPRLENLNPTARLTQHGVLDFSPTDVSIYRNGQFIVTAYDAEGNEIVRGFIYGSGTISPAEGLEGQSLTATQIQVCKDFARSIVQTSDGDVSGDWENQRWEIRRQIVANVFQNSDRVGLFYDTTLAVEAEVANQAWVHQFCSVAGAPGTLLIRKVATSGGDYDGSLNSDKTLGTELVLEAPWTFGQSTGLLTVIPRTKELFFGRSGYYDWETTGVFFNISVQSQTPIRTFTIAAGTVYAIAEKDEIFELQPNGAIADPQNILQVAAFNIGAAFNILNKTFSFSCVSTTIFTWPTVRIGFIASEGPRSYNGVEVEALFAGTNSTEWASYDRNRLVDTVTCIDPGHPFYPCVRIAGMTTNGESDNDRQLAIPYGLPTVLNLSEPLRHFDSIVSVLMENGGSQVMFGGDGRLWLYGAAPTNDSSRGVFLFPEVGGTQVGTLTGIDYEGDDAIVDSSASFNQQGDGYVFAGSRIRCVKQDDLGRWEWATAVGIGDATAILVEPDDDWTMEEGRTYTYIVGARTWVIELPQIVPPFGTTWGMCETCTFQIDLIDTGSFDWAMQYRLYGSGDTPQVDFASAVVEIEFLKSELSPMWHPKTLQAGRDYTQVVRIEGLIPPASFLTVRSVSQDVFFSGG